jgi:O-antigen biosynthesis protein WbqV
MSQNNPSHLYTRMAVNVALDGVLAGVAVIAAFWMVGVGWPRPAGLPVAGAVAIWLIGVPFGLSRLHWRYISLRDLAVIGAAAVVAALMIFLLLVGAGLSLPSVAFPVVLALALVVFLTAPKLAYRLARQRSQVSEADKTALLVGTGETAELFLQAHAGAGADYRVVGLLALSARHTGRRMLGLDVLGGVEDFGAVLARLGEKPDLLIITAPEFAGDALAGLLAVADAAGVRVLRAPSLTKLAPAVQKLDLQPVAIEDLLNRKQVALDRAGMAALIQGKRVLVTGAGGSIGSELARQVAGFGPSEILLLENSEFALWQIDLEFSESFPGVKRRAVLADVRDVSRIALLCLEFRPELVFHAAALKHVPLVEANPLEGIRTNVLGTKAVADAAAAAGAALMVIISTDKAVNPSSIMGASKRLAEMYAQGLDVQARHAGAGMRCVTVRFGNVLGSTGSVVPVFRRQLAQGGPLTVTHPEMQRYFMTVREAVGLVLQASVVGSGEAAIPDGGIFVLDMGEPVKILDLAKQMIRLAGVEADIVFTGLRPGEKLFEELFHGAEMPVPTGFEGLLMASPRNPDIAMVAAALDEIAVAADAGVALRVLCRTVPEFTREG